MTVMGNLSDPAGGRIPVALALVPARRLIVSEPVIRIPLEPGDRVTVVEGESVEPGTPLAERTVDAALIDVGSLDDEEVAREGTGDGQPADTSSTTTANRRVHAFPGKWWIGGEMRRGRLGRHYLTRNVAGPLLYELSGRWHAAAGERHEIVESPVSGVVRRAATGVEVTIEVAGAGIPAAVAAGQPSRGRLDFPQTGEADLRSVALDVGRAGAIVVAGSRIDAEAMTRARAMGIRGVVASSISSADLRDLAASEARQRASLHTLAPFAALGFDGYLRRPIPSPLAELLRALAGRDVAIALNPPTLVFDPSGVALPEVAPDWLRVRSGLHTGREGRWLGSLGGQRFRAGSHLEAARVRLDDEELALPVNDLERFIL